ncbi:protein-transmembrane prediction, partial [Planctomycetota bacterium]
LRVRGSFPYGYGSIFGIGSNNVYGLDKRCGIYISGKNVTIDKAEVQQRAFGHAIFMGPGAENVLIKNSLVEGILRPSADLYEETESHDLPFRANYKLPCDVAGNCNNGGAPIPKDQMFTLTEDGIRIYRGAGKVTVENTTVKKTRGGIRLYFGIEDTTVTNCTAIDCGSTNYNMPSGGTITGSAGNFAYAPLSDFRTAKSNQNLELTLLPSPHAMGPHNIADVQGNNHQIVFHRAPGPLDGEERAIVVTGNHSTIRNETEYPIILASGSRGNTIISAGPVTDNGNNDVSEIELSLTSPKAKAKRIIP